MYAIVPALICCVTNTMKRIGNKNFDISQTKCNTNNCIKRLGIFNFNQNSNVLIC